MGATVNKLDCGSFYKILTKSGIDYFCGIPDSLLSSFGFYLHAHAKGRHDIAANEGNAIGLAVGYYLATSKPPLVYMQNSGLGNAINPLASLVDPAVFGIPMILLIGWRGQPGRQDEPQHQKQGAITESLLQTLGIGYTVLSHKEGEVQVQVTRAISESKQYKRPYALLVVNETFQAYKSTAMKENSYPLKREDAIQQIIDSLAESDIVVATTGKTSRELFEYRENTQRGHNRDLLVVGGMGHASSIALGISLQVPSRRVFCIDGDGSVLMHMGALVNIGSKKPKNFYHFVINNGSHESVGGQPTNGFDVDLALIANACGYSRTHVIDKKAPLKKILNALQKLSGPLFIEVRIAKGSRTDISRPTMKPSENKESLMSYLKRT